MPRRNASVVERAAVLGLRLLGEDEPLRDAVRVELEAGRGALGPEGRAPRAGIARHRRIVEELESQRRKLLQLYYADRIGADLFGEEEQRLRLQISAATHEDTEMAKLEVQADEIQARFEEVARVLAELDIETMWSEATTAERRILVEELLEEVALFPDHLEVVVAGAPRLNITLEEVGVQTIGVRGGT